MSAPTQSAYPLCWPAGWVRTPAAQRVPGSFDGTPDRVRHELLKEIDRLVLGKMASTHRVSREYVVLSTDVPLRRDGEPRADVRPVCPGVAVYFMKDGKPMCFARDKYDQVWKNMRAIQKTIEALRGIERWGSSTLLERAFHGFVALPEKTGPSCWEVLGIAPTRSEAEVLNAYRARANEAHPDKPGGSETAFHAVVAAKDNALAILKGGNPS